MALEQYKTTINGNPTALGYDTEKGTAAVFSTPEQFHKYFANFDANAPAPTFDYSSLLGKPDVFMPVVPVSANPSVQNTSTSLQEAPKTNLDLQKIISDNQALQQKILDMAIPSQEMQDAQTALDNIDTSYKAGATAIKNKPIARPFITGQLAAQNEQYQNERDVAVRNLTRLQNNRANILQAYQLAQQFGSSNASLAFQLEQAKKAESQAALQFVMDNNITKPYFQVGGTLYRSSDRHPFATLDEFLNDAKVFGITDWASAQKAGVIQGSFNGGKNTTFGIIGQEPYTDPTTGTTVMRNVYGFIDPTKQTVTPTNNGAQVGDAVTNFGQQTGTIAGLPSYNTAEANPTLARPNRNNNPGNIKVSDYTKNFDGVIGVESTPATDGGNFLIFDSPQAGMAAIGRLLQEGKSYQGVTAEQAMKKYSGGAYGAIAVGLNPSQNFQAQLSDPSVLNKTVQAILTREGYKPNVNSTTTTNTTVVNGVDTKPILDALTVLKANPKLTPNDRAAMANSVNSFLQKGEVDSAVQTIVTNAITMLPAASQEKVYGKFTMMAQLADIKGMLQEFKAAGGDTNLLRGTAENWAEKVGTTSNPKLAEISTRILASLMAYRQSVTGMAFTEAETKQYNQVFPNITGTYTLNEAKINALLDSFKTDIGSSLNRVTGNQYGKMQDMLVQSANPYQQYLNSLLSDTSLEGQYLNSILSGSPEQQQQLLTGGVFGNGFASMGTGSNRTSTPSSLLNIK